MAKKLKPILRRNLLNLARAYAKAEGVLLRTVSARAYKDARFFDALAKNKCALTIDKYDFLIDWFTRHWPEGHKMPALIDPHH